MPNTLQNSRIPSDWQDAIDLLPGIRKQYRARQISQGNSQSPRRVIVGKKELDFNRRLRKALEK